MPFELISDASDLPSIPQEEDKLGLLGMWAVIVFSHNLYLVGLSGLFKKGSGSEYFRRLGQHDERVKEGDAPISLNQALLDIAQRPNEENAEAITSRIARSRDAELEVLKNHAERDAKIFGTPGHRPLPETLEAIMLLPPAVASLVKARAKTESEPFLVNEALAGLNETMTDIMNDPNISYCPELLQFAQILYTQATAPVPELHFDDAAIQIGSPLRLADFARPERFGLRRPGGGGAARSS